MIQRNNIQQIQSIQLDWVSERPYQWRRCECNVDDNVPNSIRTNKHRVMKYATNKNYHERGTINRGYSCRTKRMVMPRTSRSVSDMCTTQHYRVQIAPRVKLPISHRVSIGSIRTSLSWWYCIYCMSIEQWSCVGNTTALKCLIYLTTNAIYKRTTRIVGKWYEWNVLPPFDTGQMTEDVGSVKAGTIIFIR